MPMGHKILQDHAHSFCQLLVGWRMSDDLTLLSGLPSGMLTIDALNGTCTHDTLGDLETHVAPEIAAWFAQRLAIHRIPTKDIVAATVTARVGVMTERGKNDSRCEFYWHCIGVIRTSDRTYILTLDESHTWLTEPGPFL